MRVETEGEERGVEANRTKNLLKLCSGEAWEYLTLWSLQSRNKLNNYQHLLFLSLFGVTDGFCLQYEKICQNVHNESERSIYKSIQWLRYPTVTRHYIVILMRIYIYILWNSTSIVVSWFQRGRHIKAMLLSELTRCFYLFSYFYTLGYYIHITDDYWPWLLWSPDVKLQIQKGSDE